MKENILVAFSGGRTSAYMSWWLKEYMSHLYNFKFVYANTGLEHEKTLEFVDKCDKHFNLDLTWVEADFNLSNPEKSSYKIVDFKTATRNDILFADMCYCYGLPNGTFMHCTRELKNRPVRKFGVDTFGYDYRLALGIRHDEMKKRLKVREDAIYPLATITKMTKQQILEWWAKMPFDLEIEEHYGNCVTCFKKSDTKLQKIAHENPNYFDSFIRLENDYSFVKSLNEKEPRKIFRHFRTAYEVQNDLNLPENILTDDECPDECGSMISDFISEPIEKNLFNL